MQGPPLWLSLRYIHNRVAGNTYQNMQHLSLKHVCALGTFAVVLFAAFFAYASDSRSYDRHYEDRTEHARTITYEHDRYYDNDYAYSYKPSCSITVKSYTGSTGYDRYLTLAWSSSYATSAYISGIGSVGTNGAQAVFYPYNSSYTMTVYGPGGSATCVTQNQMYSSQFYHEFKYTEPYAYQSGYPYHTYSTTQYPVNTYTAYAQPGTVYPTYSYAAAVPATTYVAAPAAQYIKLSQTPYTGFDFGPLGNSLYWLGLALTAMLAAYSLVIYRGLHGNTLAEEVLRAGQQQLRFVRSKVRA